MKTIDLIDVFCHQSIIGIDPIDVFLTIGAQLWCFDSEVEVEAAKGVPTAGLCSELSEVYSSHDSRCGEGFQSNVLYRRYSLNFQYPNRVKPLEILMYFSLCV